MWRWKGFSPGIGGAVSVFLAAAAPAQATAIGYVFDFSTCAFNYAVGAGPNGKVGTITINDDELYGSLMSLSKLDLGADKAVGGGGGNADTDVDRAKNIDGSTFDVQLIADVIKVAANNYRLEGTLKITDTGSTLANPRVMAAFVSNTVSLASGYFLYEGPLSISGPSDALLLPGLSSSWAYEGVAGDTPGYPNEDGVLGRVTQSADRANFDTGALNGGYYADGGITTLDTFFGGNRSSTSISTQAQVLPEPVTLILGLAGVGWMAGRRRGAKSRG